MSQLDEVLALASDNTAGDFYLTGESLAVLFYAADWLSNLNNWKDVPDEPLSDADIDTIQALVDNALDQLMRPIVTVPVGATMLWHMAVPPARWLFCDGGAAYVAEYPELFALWGYKYGASGAQFGLPDMEDFIPMGKGGIVSLDGTTGAATHTLVTNEIPVHNHADAIRVGNGSPARGVVSSGSATLVNINAITANNGGGMAHNNIPPVFGVNFIVYGGRE